MQTRKPVATISFNSHDYLTGRLQELTQNGVLEFWAVIEHQPEPDEVNDEAGHKTHFHVYMEPAKQVQTTALRDQFKEPDPVFGKPKGCLQIVSSRFDDWYLYALHEPAYLASKKQARVYVYDATQVVSSDAGDLQQKVAAIDLSGRDTYLTMWQYQAAGRTFAEYMIAERIAVRDVAAFNKAWNVMASFGLSRNGRPGHENSFKDIEQTTLPNIDPIAIEEPVREVPPTPLPTGIEERGQAAARATGAV